MPESQFDPALSAEFHNKILEHAWTGAGNDLVTLPSTTWWQSSAPVEIDSRLVPNLSSFLRLAKVVNSTPPGPGSGLYFFYFLRGLQEQTRFFDSSTLKTWGDRFVWLYPATGAVDIEEVGIIFDQSTELAAFFPDWESLICDCEKSWQWRPLQDILAVYLQMIEDRKVYTSSIPSKFFPWNLQNFTKCDIEKAVAAFIRLIDAIEQKLPTSSSPQTQIDLLYPTTVLDKAYIKEDTFLRSFLLALPRRYLSFRYIAPGIQLQSLSDITDQPFPKLFSDLSDRIDYNEKDTIPLLLFRGEGESISPWVGPWFPDGEPRSIPAGLYIEDIHKDIAQDYGNQCKLLLPFGIGANGYARSSNGLLLGYSSNPPLLTDEADQLYQIIYYSGLLPGWSHGQFLDKILTSWAERVELGDWVVTEDGVSGGMEKFKEADTSLHWEKYYTAMCW